MTTTEKACIRCHLVQSMESFNRQTKAPDGRQGICRQCAKIANAAWRAANPDRRTENWRKWQYGVTPEVFAAMMDRQDGKCRICLVSFEQTTPYLDHDHSCCPGAKSCGECLRSILCRNCNWGLGQFNDRPDLLRGAACYLEDLCD